MEIMSKFLVCVLASSFNYLIQFGVKEDLGPDTNWKCQSDSSLIKQSVSLKLS